MLFSTTRSLGVVDSFTTNNVKLSSFLYSFKHRSKSLVSSIVMDGDRILLLYPGKIYSPQ